MVRGLELWMRKRVKTIAWGKGNYSWDTIMNGLCIMFHRHNCGRLAGYKELLIRQEYIV